MIGFRKMGVGTCCSIRPASSRYAAIQNRCIECDGTTATRRFYELCRTEAGIREAGASVAMGRIGSMRFGSPSRMMSRMRSQSNDIHKLQMRDRRNKNAIKLLKAQEVNIPNLDIDQLLGDEKEWNENYKKLIEGEKDVTKREIFELLFQEMAIVRARKKKFGSHHGHVFSPLMIMFAGHIRFGNGGSSGISKDNWDFLVEAFHIPKNGCLMQYHHTDTSSPDGPCIETILQNAEFIDKLSNGDLDHPIRDGKISIDSHKIKGRFGTYVKMCLYVTLCLNMSRPHYTFFYI